MAYWGSNPFTSYQSMPYGMGWQSPNAGSFGGAMGGYGGGMSGYGGGMQGMSGYGSPYGMGGGMQMPPWMMSPWMGSGGGSQSGGASGGSWTNMDPGTGWGGPVWSPNMTEPGGGTYAIGSGGYALDQYGNKTNQKLPGYFGGGMSGAGGAGFQGGNLAQLLQQLQGGMGGMQGQQFNQTKPLNLGPTQVDPGSGPAPVSSASNQFGPPPAVMGTDSPYGMMGNQVGTNGAFLGVSNPAPWSDLTRKLFPGAV